MPHAAPMSHVALSGLQQLDLATKLKNYTYLTQRRNYYGQINARREYCSARGGDKIARTKIQLKIH